MQAVVQFATCMEDNRRYAVKFFLDQNAFKAESALYGAFYPALRTSPDIDVAARCVRIMHEAHAPIGTAVNFLPKVEAVLDGTQDEVMDSNGNGSAMPPCIVMERGESLHEWAERTEPDLCKVFTVRTSRHSEAMHCNADLAVACYIYSRPVFLPVVLPVWLRWVDVDCCFWGSWPGLLQCSTFTF